jgi:hypothetical protein
MSSKVTECIAAIADDGQLKDSVMDALGIIRMEGDVAEFADKVYYQQHEHVVNHEQSKRRYINYRQMKANSIDPVHIAAVKTIAADNEKRISALQKETEKKSAYCLFYPAGPGAGWSGRSYGLASSLVVYSLYLTSCMAALLFLISSCSILLTQLVHVSIVLLIMNDTDVLTP